MVSQKVNVNKILKSLVYRREICKGLNHGDLDPLARFVRFVAGLDDGDGFLPDTGGPGKHRGGLALVREYRFTEAEGTLQIRSDRHRSRPYGLSGGSPGTLSRNILNPDGEARTLPSKTLLTPRR